LTGGCTVGDLVFSNFSDAESASGGGTPLTAAGITVETVGPTGDFITGPDDGLAFNGGWDASAGQVVDSSILFTVSLVGGGTEDISDAGLAQLADAFGSGSANVIEDGCITPAGCNPLSDQWGLITLNTATISASTDSTDFGASTFTNVAKDISVAGGTNGFAALSLVEDTFSQVPEPRALALLLGLGLVAGGVFRKKLQGAR